MKIFVLSILLIFFTTGIFGKALLKNNFEYDFKTKNLKVFELYIVGNMELVVGFDYELKIKKNNKSKKAKKRTDEFMFVLPVPNTITSWKTEKNTLFKDLYNSTLPEKMPNVKKKKKLPKRMRRINNRFKVVVQDVFKPAQLGKKAFDEVNEYLKKNGYNELSFNEYKYYIDRSWSFVVIKYVTKKGYIAKKGSVQPIYLSLEADSAAFPLRIFKDSPKLKTDIYVLSSFDLELKDVKNYGLKTIEQVDNELSQSNRLTIITELGDSVVNFYDRISSKNEDFKDMENNNLRLFHVYGVLNDKNKISSWDASTDFLLENK